jgi:hypothetical protein
MMEIKVAEIKDNIYAQNKGKGELFLEPFPNHKRRVRSTAQCPWHKEISESLLADHSKGTFRCLSCGVEGLLVEGTNDRFLALQREDA